MQVYTWHAVQRRIITEIFAVALISVSISLSDWCWFLFRVNARKKQCGSTPYENGLPHSIALSSYQFRSSAFLFDPEYIQYIV